MVERYRHWTTKYKPDPTKLDLIRIIPSSRCARIIEEHEKKMAIERQLEAKSPHRGLLVDPALIEAFYGPPSLKEKDVIESDLSEMSSTKDAEAKANPCKATPTTESWADSESEDEEQVR